MVKIRTEKAHGFILSRSEATRTNGKSLDPPAERVQTKPTPVDEFRKKTRANTPSNTATKG